MHLGSRKLKLVDLLPNISNVDEREPLVELTLESVGDYLNQNHPTVVDEWLGDQASNVREISEGNLNHVFEVSSRKVEKRSVCVKQSLPYIRVVPEFKLTVDRILFECACMRLFEKFVPNSTPKVLLLDEKRSCMVTEFLHGYEVLRHRLVSGSDTPNLGKEIGTQLAALLFPTTLFAMEASERCELVEYFERNSPLRKVTEEAIFTSPFICTGKPTFENRWTKGFYEPVIDRIQSDPRIHSAVARLKWKFCNQKDAFLHGDLHTGSIMVNGSGDVRFFDCEFCFMGPVAFDVGIVLGNLFISALSKSNETEYNIIMKHASDLWEAFKDKFFDLWKEEKKKPVDSEKIGGKISFLFQSHVSGESFVQEMLEEIWADSIGFAACEMIRRTIGVAHVEDLESIEDIDLRGKHEQQVLEVACEILSPSSPIPSFSVLFERFSQHKLSLPPKTLKKFRLCLVAKLPKVGISKTRLGVGIGDEKAAAFARCCVGDLVDKFGSSELEDVLSAAVGDACELDLTILFTPSEDEERYRDFLNDECSDSSSRWKLRPLHSEAAKTGQLGDTLASAYRSAVEEGCDCVGFLGMDTPDLSVNQVVQSLAESVKNYTTILPASDGGYVYLCIPCYKEIDPRALFEGVVWSSSATFATQVRALSQLSLHVLIGELYSDIDELEHYLDFKERIVGDPLLQQQLPRLTSHFNSVD